jgi:hypothetical protein
VDWNEFTAIATGVLALGLIPTAIGIWITYKAATDDLHATQRAAELALMASREELQATREATQTAQEMAQRQLEASYRPLLIDGVRTGPVSENDRVPITSEGRINIEFPGGHGDAFDPRQIYVALWRADEHRGPSPQCRQRPRGADGRWPRRCAITWRASAT